MKKLGMIGGTGPESTVDYYQSIISRFQEDTGSKESLPELLIYSINMYKIFDLLQNNQEEELAEYLAAAVLSLERAGADFAVISANTPHIVFDKVQQKVNIPMISIVEESYRTAHQLEIHKIGLLGTKFTMENDFFKEPFMANGKEIFVPNEEDQQFIHEKIVKELEQGIVNEETKKEFLVIAERMIEQHDIEGLILGCTELPMIFKPQDLDIPQLNTVEIHVAKIVDMITAD
ncbi:amino acid racemase [Microbacterium sp. APC 3898]|uniref:Amino acid racemase n=1 Tax=Planococcus notacanthi TaxID=3035188 RepID=A0ABT7ZJK4_9BACL|nr:MULTISPECIES: amino acid racemase [Terrabacteria group]MDN3427329.1 amino acid racemase [Planococcus sp. APC 4016]MDN3436678.1 amino acid racemase [Planococcus sp. APC 3900]MDN3499611.1 amino acid racemase [Microbacterium sp. APC 3898]